MDQGVVSADPPPPQGPPPARPAVVRGRAWPTTARLSPPCAGRAAAAQGNVTAALKRGGMYNDTLVVFSTE